MVLQGSDIENYNPKVVDIWEDYEKSIIEAHSKLKVVQQVYELLIENDNNCDQSDRMVVDLLKRCRQLLFENTEKHILLFVVAISHMVVAASMGNSLSEQYKMLAVAEQLIMKLELELQNKGDDDNE